MTRTPRNNPTPRPPTSRDGIDAWLDVLTSMLALPPSQRAQVRDELEDHLRSRVDDLLIAGSPEPEAVRTAIAELGETAQLARHITSANHTPKSFRRFAMNATFFVLAGSILTAGVSMMMPNAPQQQTSAAGQTESVETSRHQPAESDPLNAFTINVRSATLSDMFQNLESHTDRPVIVHWDQIANLGFDRESVIGIDSQPIKADLVLTILAERTEQEISDSIAVLQTDNRIEIGTRSQFDRRTRAQKIYDLSIFEDITEKFERNLYRGGPAQVNEKTLRTILTLLEGQISPHDWDTAGGDLASAGILNQTLVVTAPERVHDQIKTMLHELHQQHIEQQRAHQQYQQQSIERLNDAFAAIRESLKNVRMEIRAKQEELKRIGTSPFHNINDPDARAQAELQAQALHAKIEELKLQEQELDRRHGQYQSMLINYEFKDLISPSTQHESTSTQPTDAPTYTVLGEVHRPGLYRLPEQGDLTLSRLIHTAGGIKDPDTQILLLRNGESRMLGRVADLNASDYADMKLARGDVVRFSTHEP